jgi:phage repressor protein C with HTH and peptisase S24 domain
MDFKKDYKKLVGIVKRLQTAMGKPSRNEDIARELGYNRSYFSSLLGERGVVSEDHLRNIKLHFPILNELEFLTNSDIDRILSSYKETLGAIRTDANSELTYIEKRKLKKTETDPENDGILYVPIAAQAGYSTRFHDPIYLTQLERVHLPGFPYRGNRFRVFDVKGDSMEPTYKEGYHLVCELVDQDSWHQTANYYIYVIVLQSDILVKRLFRKDKETFVAISDNEEFHPQFLIKIQEIKELWQVKRKIDWEMAPPKKFEIKI